MNADFDLRTVTEIGAERPRQQVNGRRPRRRRWVKCPVLRLCSSLICRMASLAQFQHVFRVADQGSAGRGQRQLRHVAGEQRHTNRVSSFFTLWLTAG